MENQNIQNNSQTIDSPATATAPIIQQKKNKILYTTRILLVIVILLGTALIIDTITNEPQNYATKADNNIEVITTIQPSPTTSPTIIITEIPIITGTPQASISSGPIVSVGE